MVSSTAQTERRRRMKEAKRGRDAKKKRGITPAFPIHPEGYDPQAPDAKSASKTA